MLELRNINKCYITKNEKVNALKNVNFTFPDKGLFVLMGPSGCGKSSLLNILTGLDSKYEGRVLYNNENIKDIYNNYRNEISYMTQSFNLFDNLTVFENVNLSLELLGKSDKTKVETILKDFEIFDLANKKCNTLSGGEKARVSIARAVIKNPKIIFCDEPTGNLDDKTSKLVWTLLKKISETVLVIIASHDEKNSYEFGNVIKIIDGQINEEIINNVVSNKNSFIKYKTSSNLSLKLLFKVFNNKKMLYILSILIMSISFIMFGLFNKLSSVNIKKAEINTIINSDINEITLYKKGNINDYTIYFSQNDLKTTHKLLQNSDSYYASSLLSNNNIFTFEFENTIDITDYYKLYNSSANENNVFIDERLCSFKILGRKPIYENEIMISNFLADYIIRFGAFDEDGNQISFNNYNDILESTLKVSNEKVVISGIYIVNENIKEKGFISLGDKDLLLKYLYTYYVNENYFKISKFSENFVSPGLFDFKVDEKDAQVYLSDEVLENEIYIDSDKNKVNLNIIDKNKLFNGFNNSYELNVVKTNGLILVNSNLLKDYILPHQLIKEIIVKNFNKNNITELLNYEKNGIYYKSQLTESLENYVISFENTVDAFKKLSITFIFFTMIVLICYVHFYYKENEEKIYSLKIAGANNKFIYKIFAINSSVILSVSLLIYVVFILIFVFIMNNIISLNINYKIEVFNYNFLNVTIYFCTMFIFLNIINYIKLKRILK
mgnify:FL=1|jgi:ABC-type lipoprotein export system ATPase subunit